MKNLIPNEFRCENKITIIFSVNRKYLPYLDVLMNSILKNSNKKDFYDFIVLHTEELGEVDFYTESGYLEGYEKNSSVRFFNISEMIGDEEKFFTANKKRITKESYYRLYIPFILDNTYDRVIYMDSDMVTLSDMSCLMDVEFDGEYIAATRDYSGIAKAFDPNDRDLFEYREKVVRISNQEDYVISGTIVYNLKEIRKNFSLADIENVILSRNWKQHDQDILNFIFNGKIKIIDAKWNVVRDFGNNKFLTDRLYDEWKKSRSNCIILHYAGAKKPWNCDVPRENIYHFWKYAVKSQFFNLIIQNMSRELKLKTDSSKLVSSYEDIKTLVENSKGVIRFEDITNILKGI